MKFTEDKYTVVNLRAYKQVVDHAVNVEPEYVHVWSDPENDCWDYDQTDVVVGEDEVLIQESNKSVMQGRYVTLSQEDAEKLVDRNVFESTR